MARESSPIPYNLTTLSLLILAVLFATLLFGCKSSDNIRGKVEQESFVLTGTMEFVDVEGGCWRFRADDGAHYEPTGTLVERLQFDGLQAEILARPVIGRGSVCMVGKLIEIIEIRSLIRD